MLSAQRRILFIVLTLILASALAAAGCKGENGDTILLDPPPVETPREVEPGEDPPGVNIEILGLSGGSGVGGRFLVGGTITVNFTIEKDDASTWDITEMNFARILVSGPTFNYQRVITERTDLASASVQSTGGDYIYTFPVPIPATYAAPVNDSPSFDADDGELTGQPLLDGTYTVGMYAAFNYTVEGDSFRDVGNATADLLIGPTATLQTHDVVGQDNCNQCHVSLRAHGGLRQEVKLCVLCHTSGAEDRNDPMVLGGTPGVSVEFRVMIHKIHNGAHLPSVLGVATNPGGSRNYAAGETPYEIIGFNNSIHDYSHVAFPVWPNLSYEMPQDQGYDSLPGPDQDLEDEIRGGVTACAKCHGDPDGAGPLSAPAEGDLAFAQPTRRACGSCHDDVDWSELYVANGQSMPAQPDDSLCIICHPMQGSGLAVANAHLHPLKDLTADPGLIINLTAVAEGGVPMVDHDDDGTLDPGERIAITFDVTDRDGNPIAGDSLDRIETVVTGPTTNSNVLVDMRVPPAALTGMMAPYTINLPEVVHYEFVGISTVALDVFTTLRVPHWDVTDGETTVSTRTMDFASSQLAAAAEAHQNYIDIDSAVGFADDDYIVIDDTGPNEEYLKIQWVEGNRLWFSSPHTRDYAPGTRFQHSAMTSVTVVTLTDAVPVTDYTLDAATGTITEVLEFGLGVKVIVTYTSDFLVPNVYGVSINGSPDLGEDVGEMTGKPLVDGTYTASLWGRGGTFTVTSFPDPNDDQSYRVAAPAVAMDFLVGSATALTPYDLVSSPENCYSCHDELRFHGGSRLGYESCISCHGTVGAEDRPQYVTPSALPTPGVSISFREMLHKIHMGADLANASTYAVIGFGGSVHNYGEVEFPAFPGGVLNCVKCHGVGSDTWLEPAPREHPTVQVNATQEWKFVCGSCHDGDAAQAHMSSQTLPNGAEGCQTCHGDGKELNVEKTHKPR